MRGGRFVGGGAEREARCALVFAADDAAGAAAAAAIRWVVVAAMLAVAGVIAGLTATG